MKNPAVTVIVAMFNAQDFIADCLTSLLNQTFQDFEIIVADDCSTDSSLAVVQNFLPEFGDRLRILTLSKNSGHPGIPRNFALEAARGKYVCFLDSDDMLSENAPEDFFNVAKFLMPTSFTPKNALLLPTNKPKSSVFRRANS